MKFNIKYVILGVFLVLAACGMKSPYYQKLVKVPGVAWAYDFRPTFKIHIDDTVSHYQTKFLIRHDEAYPFANLWFRMKVKGPGDTAFVEGERIEVILADAEGKWQGTGTGDLWEHVVPLSLAGTPMFGKAGDYTIKLEQVMRVDPLPSVMDVGLRIEKK